MTRLLSSLALLGLFQGAVAYEPVATGLPSFEPIEDRRRFQPPPVRDTAPVTEQQRTQSRDRATRWLKAIQQADGGWGAGAWGTSTHQVPSDVATTAFVTMALIRDSGIHGTHRSAIEKGVDHVLLAIETAPDDSPRLRTPDGTQIQYKLGQLVDTHMASLLLGEVYGKMGGSRHARIQKAYARVLSKVQLAQQADGSFDANGWAPVLSTSIASQGLYKAVDNGVAVDQSVLDRADAYSNAQVSESGEADASDGAGVALYGVASALAGNKQASGRTASPSAARAETKARAMSETIASDSSGALIQGFGSMGGEEMLSYMLISDTLAEDGGKAFTQWDQKIGAHLLNIQNRDGSWVGHHCITSAVFVTAGALATLAAGDSAHARTREAKVRGDRG